MASPYFYFADLASVAIEFALPENTSRHIVQVLRMSAGEELRLTDGKGLSATASVREADKKKCLVTTIKKEKQDSPKHPVSIGLSLLKNTSRFEWFLEKATELGITEIIPLKCARTEKQQFRSERLQGILESALIQSQQVWMPVMQDPQNLIPWMKQVEAGQKFIAHCDPGVKRKLSDSIDTSLPSRLILIGPEGDFTDEEIKQAIQAGFIPVELGETRLRSETAAVAAAAVLKLF